MNRKSRNALARLAAFLTGSVLLCAAPGANAVVIDFDAFTPASPFVAGIEDGFTITGTANAFITPNGFGNPALAATVQAPGVDPLYTFVNGGSFQFVSLDIDDAFGVGSIPNITVQGFLGAALIGTDSYAVPLNYTTFSANNLASQTIDRLTILVTSNSVGPAAIDNVTFNVPEPGTLALFGLASLGFVRRRISK